MLQQSVFALISAFVAFGHLKSKFYDTKYNVKLLQEYDYIIIGAGTTGSVIANRLSENPNTTVLVLEAGGSGRGNAYSDVPFFAERLSGSSVDWFYSSSPQKELGNRRIFYVRGKIAGGTSCFNYMLYNRGSINDYSGWEEAGAEGWTFSDVEKYFRKLERATDPNLAQSLGRNGMLSLTRSYLFDNFYEFIAGSVKELGYAAVDALEQGGISEGISKVTYTVFNGLRQNAARAYLWPAWDDRNGRLHFSFHSLVHKVLLSTTQQDNMHAYGVSYEKDGVIRKVNARREVVVCGGVINSPQILMLSGIGPRDHLEKLNIQVNVNLPGVGKNLQDHPGLLMHYYGDKFPKHFTKSEDESIENFSEYLKLKNTSLSYPAYAQSGVAHFHLNGIDDKIVKPSIPIAQIYFTARKSSTKSVIWPTADIDAINEIVSKQNNIFANFEYILSTLRVKSRGSITLVSNKATDAAIFDPNILSHPHDKIVLIEAMRLAERIEKSKSFQSYGLHLVPHPSCMQFFGPVPRSNAYYTCLIAHSAYATFHACCTNKMGSRSDEMSVVDAKLRVHGVQRLRVADASVMPDIVSGNPQAACYMIGEKAADMIKSDY